MGSHLDPQLEDRILHEVKSQGVFDEFRKDSMADVDTKPAYQNLRQRVENTVKKFLSEQHWTPDMNKNQLREKLRRHITESGFLDVGVERIVDQVVNPKIGTVFQPRIEEITYKYLGLPPPPVKHEPPPPIMHPLPPLPLTGPPPLKIETSSLLPTGLEQVSPDSDKATVKSESREDDKSIIDMDIDMDDKMIEEDDESPPFEPLVKCVEEKHVIKTETMIKKESEVDEKLEMATSKIEPMSTGKPLKSEFGKQEEIRDSETQDTSGSTNPTNPEPAKNLSLPFEADAALSQDSQLSQVSSDSHISDVTANASHSFMDNSSAHNTSQAQDEAVMELASANISEEAQMPKFNENSCEMSGPKSNLSELHFDIKKDEIKFEGTERKINLMEQEGECNSVIGDISPRQRGTLGGNLENKEQPHHFGNLNIDTNVEPNDQKSAPKTPAATPTQTPHDSSFGSSLEDISYQHYADNCEDGVKNESVAAAISVSLPEQSAKKEASSSQNRGSSSSSRHKKHSKDKRHSHGSKEKYKDRDRSKNRDKSKDKDKGSDKDRSSDKSRHRDKECSRDKDKERREKERRKDRSKEKEKSHRRDKHTKTKSDSMERSGSSKRSSSSAGRSHDTSSSKNDKGGTSKSANTFISSSSSSSRSESHDARREKREYERKKHLNSSNNENSSKKDDSKSAIDDHSIEKLKVQRRKSTDSNDEGKGGSGGGGAGRQNGGSEHVRGSVNSSGTSYDKQQSQQKDSKNTSPSSQSPKSKPKDGVEESGYEDKHTGALNITNEMCEIESTKAAMAQAHRNKVVILNDMLENPNVNFIDLGPTMTTYSIAKGAGAAAICNTPPKIDISPPDIDIALPETTSKSPATHISSTSSLEVEEEQLLFFDEMNAPFSDRLRLLDNAMDRCRRVVNNLRFDCGNELYNSFEAYEEQQSKNELDTNVTTQSCATLSVDCVPVYSVENCFMSNQRCGASPVENAFDNDYEPHAKRRRNNIGQSLQSKPSPTPSDASVNSKENMALDKNADMVKCIRRIASVNKLNQQQRYSSEDLYKPRPVLSQRSRRRGMDTII
ncbi:biorientation of chromosomes in cell division protein 1-like 1 [Anastrepha ludens]|uniref:biorientation of chromosomes in cell division protein 1-like 1 n=1 Tax=Anastrepha ludens TaxID=28586 RepID=UPI0023B0FE5B|nr:biorientation of chromosomes in cell division protein 1-like 1 [Anastrepha ludens]